ncbi:Non-POU domain-containing octamer-binding protein [Nymphon striatum]|nr:Non-POU domain-containing octamer-binding protein [Nymphon striatum]
MCKNNFVVDKTCRIKESINHQAFTIRNPRDGTWSKNRNSGSSSVTNSPAPHTPIKDGEVTKKPGAGGRSRLFIGNITEDTKEEQLREVLEKYGKITELYVNAKRGFAFVKFETKVNADSAKDALDGTKLNNKVLRVRYAAHGAALRVKNLSPHVTNELLEQAFGTFGVVERCIHIVDERGRPIGEGIVEFQRKHSSQIALKKCQDGCFLLGSLLLLSPWKQNDEDDGHQEKNVIKNQRYHRELEKCPRFVPKDTFEYDFAMRWKELFEVEKKKREQLELDIQEQRAKLEEQMEFAIYESETQKLRDQLRMREEEANQLMHDHEMRRDDIRRRSDHRHQEELMFHNQDDRMRQGPSIPLEEMRRRPDPMMIQQEIRHNSRGSKGNTPMRGNERTTFNGSSPAADPVRPNQGNSSLMQNMPGTLVGAPVPPLDLMNAGIHPSPQVSESYFYLFVKTHNFLYIYIYTIYMLDFRKTFSFLKIEFLYGDAYILAGSSYLRVVKKRPVEFVQFLSN